MSLKRYSAAMKILTPLKKKLRKPRVPMQSRQPLSIYRLLPRSEFRQHLRDVSIAASATIHQYDPPDATSETWFVPRRD